MKLKVLIFITFLCFGEFTYGQFGYKYFRVDSAGENYHIRWKEYMEDSSKKSDMYLFFTKEVKKLLSPLLDSIHDMISINMPKDKSEEIRFGVSIIYSKSGDILDLTYLVNKEALYLFSESLLLDISHLLLKLHIDYPLLEYIEKRWLRQLPEKQKRPTGRSMIYLRLYFENQ